MSIHQEYGSEKEGLLIAILAFLILSSLGLVILLNKSVAKPCTEHEYVFCGSENKTPANEHH
jgi:hypothetical protein